MKRIALELNAATIDALTTRDLRLVHASMRYHPDHGNPTPAGFDVAIEHTSGQGAAVTGSGRTVLEALSRATSAFDRYVRAELEHRLQSTPKRRRRPTVAPCSAPSSSSAPSPSSSS